MLAGDAQKMVAAGLRARRTGTEACPYRISILTMQGEPQVHEYYRNDAGALLRAQAARASCCPRQILVREPAHGS